MIFEKVRELIAEQFEIAAEDITEDTDFVADLEADSLDVVELAMNIEDNFDLPEISEEDIKSIQTVGDLVAYIASHRN